MSTKTLRKRIALVAVSAMGAGLLSVVPAQAANIAGNTQAVTTNSTFNVATVASTTGAASAVATAVGAANTSTSVGLVYKDSSSTTAQTATMLSNGALALYTGLSSATALAVTATGGAFSSASAAANAAVPGAVAGSQKSVYWSSATAVAVLWTPGAVGTYTLALYKGDGAGSVPTAAIPAAGTLVGQIVVTVVATSVSGTLSVPDSTCVLNTSAAAASADASGAELRSNGQKGYIYFALVDAYGSALSSGGSLVVNATNGAIVNIGSTIADATSSTDVDGSTVTGYVTIAQGTSNAPVSTVVTLTYNGTTVCSKALTIAGEASKLTVTTKATQATSGTSWTDADYGVSGGIFYAQLFDSAGNLVVPASGGFSSSSATLGSYVTAASVATYATAIATTDTTGLWPSVNSLGTVTCGINAGTQKGLKMTYQNTSGSIITSNAFDVRCAGNPATYTASFDKASYSPGEIATLTVKFFDSKGNPANGLTTGSTATITTGSALTIVTALASGARADKDGVKTYKYTVGTTTGSFNALVDFPTLTAGTATIQTVPYKLSDGAVSNTEVLAAIVKLIASINKQIVALQKLLTKKK